MIYRLLMLSPVFEEPPEVVREDVAEACVIVAYETPEALVATIQDAMKALCEQLHETP